MAAARHDFYSSPRHLHALNLRNSAEQWLENCRSSHISDLARRHRPEGCGWAQTIWQSSGRRGRLGDDASHRYGPQQNSSARANSKSQRQGRPGRESFRPRQLAAGVSTVSDRGFERRQSAHFSDVSFICVIPPNCRRAAKCASSDDIPLAANRSVSISR